MNESIGRLLAVVGAVVTALLALAGLFQLPGSLTGTDGAATGAMLVATGVVAIVVVVVGRRWGGGRETPYW